jgi:hypothetical protein
VVNIQGTLETVEHRVLRNFFAGSMKFRPVFLDTVDVIEHQAMQMNIEISGQSDVLDEFECAGLRIRWKV